jgi:hypothetical protein
MDDAAVIPAPDRGPGQAPAGIQALRLLRFIQQSEIRNAQSVARVFAARSVRFEPVFDPFWTAFEFAK